MVQPSAHHGVGTPVGRAWHEGQHCAGHTARWPSLPGGRRRPLGSDPVLAAGPQRSATEWPGSDVPTLHTA